MGREIGNTGCIFLSPSASVQSDLLKIHKSRGFKIGSLILIALINIDEFTVFMEKKTTFDILAINETRLDNSISDSLINLPGSHQIRHDTNRTVVEVFMLTSEMA